MSSAPVPRSSAAEYAARGPIYQQAWQILCRGCDVPPSLELFDYELEVARRKESKLGVEALAKRLARSYQPVRGFFPENG